MMANDGQRDLALQEEKPAIFGGRIPGASCGENPLMHPVPDLKPVENVGQFMRENRFSNRVFQSYDDILDRCLPGSGGETAATTPTCDGTRSTTG